MLLWEEYVTARPDERTWRYTQFCEHYKAFAQRLKRSMRQHRRAGEKLFIDFAGPTVALHDGARAQVFVAAIGASSYTFACASRAQKLEDWVECIVRALHFYGGVPQLLVPDNASALIASADRYEPCANDTVRDLARHYGTSVRPARPRSPKDKATAESAVQVVTRWILARLLHQRFDTVAQVDAAITALLPSLNDRPFQKLPSSRASVFAELDRPVLMPLPMEARVTLRGIELLLRGNRIASHARSQRRGGFTTVESHMPAAHRAHLQWTPQRLIEWGQRIDPATGEVVTRLLAHNKHPEHGYRACLGLLGLAKRYGNPRLEATCERTLALGAFKYRHVRDMLANNRDRIDAPAPTRPGPARRTPTCAAPATTNDTENPEHARSRHRRQSARPQTPWLRRRPHRTDGPTRRSCAQLRGAPGAARRSRDERAQRSQAHAASAACTAQIRQRVDRRRPVRRNPEGHIPTEPTVSEARRSVRHCPDTGQGRFSPGPHARRLPETAKDCQALPRKSRGAISLAEGRHRFVLGVESSNVGLATGSRRCDLRLTVMSPTQCACNAGRQPPLRHRRGGPGHRQQRCPRAADLRGRDLAYLGNSPDSRRVARLPRLPQKGLPRP